MSPDGSTKPLPEEKLLKLIREKGPRPATAVPSSPAPSAASPSSAPAASALPAMGQPLPWPRLAAGALGAILLVETLYLLSQLMRPAPPVALPVVAGQTPSVAASAVPPPQDLPSLARSAARPLFAAPSGDGYSVDTPHAGGAPSSAAKDLAARLTLMGIVAGNPAQAIIEDAQTKKTYFVTTGQAVVEGAVLERVLDNRIILDLNGEKIELNL